MNDVANGYLGTTNGNGNGNGNGHDKVFDIKKADDPLLSKIVPEARRRVCQNTKIPESARMFFCWLTDMSLLFGAYIRRGVIKFSDADLAARFKVSDKTIRNWKRWIEATGEVWLTEKWMKNSFPQTVYNITAIVGQATLPLSVESEDGNLADDQVFSSNRRRQQNSRRAGNGKFGCRLHGETNCPECRQTPPRVFVATARNTTVAISEEITPEVKILPPTAAIDCRPPRQMVSAHHGNTLPLPTESDCRPARQTVAAEDGNGLPRGAANGFRTARQTVADNKETQVGESGVLESTDKAINRLENRNRLKSASKKRQKLEEEFLEKVALVLGKPELERNGGLWVNNFRTNATRANAVLDEVKVMAREGRVATSNAKAAVDLWKRWAS